MRHSLNKIISDWGNMLQAITNVRIRQKILLYWFTLLHFVIDDPVDSAYCIPYRMENPAAAAA